MRFLKLTCDGSDFFINTGHIVGFGVNGHGIYLLLGDSSELYSAPYLDREESLSALKTLQFQLSSNDPCVYSSLAFTRIRC